MTASTAITGSILIRVGDNGTIECATFSVPLTVEVSTSGHRQVNVALGMGNWRDEIVSALHEAADHIQAGGSVLTDPDRDDAAQ